MLLGDSEHLSSTPLGTWAWDFAYCTCFLFCASQKVDCNVGHVGPPRGLCQNTALKPYKTKLQTAIPDSKASVSASFPWESEMSPVSMDPPVCSSWVCALLYSPLGCPPHSLALYSQEAGNPVAYSSILDIVQHIVGTK
jgi:hypothetical protein